MAPGIPLHVVLRGAAPAQPARALDGLRCAGAGGRLHAYVLMGTHVHLLLTPVDARCTDRARAAFGAREADATPVYARRYVLACMRYIELNPVRAGLVRHPAHYRWSSYRANALGAPDPLLTPHALYCALGRDAAERCAAYRRSFPGAATV